MIVILIMGGFQMLMLGVIGEYLWRTLAQVRNRDPYIIDAIYYNVGRIDLQRNNQFDSIDGKKSAEYMVRTKESIDMG